MPALADPTISKDSLTVIGKFVYRAVKEGCSPEYIGKTAKEMVEMSEQNDKSEISEAD